MSRKKTNKVRDCFLSSPECANDRFGRVYVSLLKSQQYIKLSNAEARLLIACITQRQAGQQALYKFNEAEGTDYRAEEGYFVFPSEHLKKYGVDRSNAAKRFEALEQAGFIKRIESNKHRCKMNVYRLSADWQKSD